MSMLTAKEINLSSIKETFMLNEFSRTERLLGTKGVEMLKQSRVAVFGVGGVGSYTVEALARSGVGSITIIDNDDVALSNINRQLPATHKTIGRLKVDVVAEHIMEINPCCKVTALPLFYSADTDDKIDLSAFDYVVDAIDTVSAKLLLIEKCSQLGVRIISSMGAGNKLDPTRFEVSDIYKTSVCPLAKVMRRELKARGIEKLKVVFSKEEALTPFETDDGEVSSKRQIPGSIAFVPSVAGLIIAGEVIKDIAFER